MQFLVLLWSRMILGAKKCPDARKNICRWVAIIRRIWWMWKSFISHVSELEQYHPSNMLPTIVLKQNRTSLIDQCWSHFVSLNLNFNPPWSTRLVSTPHPGETSETSAILSDYKRILHLIICWTEFMTKLELKQKKEIHHFFFHVQNQIQKEVFENVQKRHFNH